MHGGQRKRSVLSCVPCYTRKQKCNRQYPCNHCTRRRRPELCSYYTSRQTQEAGPPAHTENRANEDVRPVGCQWVYGLDSEPSIASPTLDVIEIPQKTEPCSLVEVFGYLEDSASNTMALVRKLVAHEEDNCEGNWLAFPYEQAVEAQKMLETMPNRPILDFLVQYFFAEVNWMEQLLHPPWFLRQYQKWWNFEKPSAVAEIEFAVLFLRICSYASQFLPSPAYTIDRIRGMCLVDVRKSCDGVADTLAPLCARLDGRGSLIRVQHLIFAGLASLCEGRTSSFWDTLSCAIRAAQRISIATTPRDGNLDEIDKEMRRRTFCNLYIWDSLLSRRLDSIPFLPRGLSDDNMPQMHLVLQLDDAAGAPDVFAERVIQAKLADFWRSQSSAKGSKYDIIVAEERYERFCNEFLPTVPPVFALLPDKQWDESLPTLPMQRQISHMAIFESLCYNFRPVILLEPGQIQCLPCYKQILLSSQKKALAAAAFRLLECVSTLHKMMGGSHTRSASIIIPTFEAAVLLLCLCADKNFPGKDFSGKSSTMKTGPLGADMPDKSSGECLQAVRSAFCRLQALAEVSRLAEVGARTLSRLIGNIDNQTEPMAINGDSDKDALDDTIQISEPWAGVQTPKDVSMLSLTDLLSDSTGSGITDPNWKETVERLSDNYALGHINFLDGGQ
ncbi:hypothetical protein F5Y13DRAFT_205604 [Hypoxylon sp. FL1857]|nr:hypothetical protein F5Y13DRAFT_205604 [Hypoxylon sp. FL1857]